jgi:GNAT superfamily N-acetyltransferase
VRVTDPLPAWRTALGHTARLWSGSGRHEVERDRWLAFSGARTVDLNVALCHSGDSVRNLAYALDAVAAAQVPALILVAGAALAAVNVLTAASWVCVGARPFMVMTDSDGAPDPDARALKPSELPLAQKLVSEAFGLDLSYAEVALPAAAGEGEAWGLFADGELVSCTGVSVAGDVGAIWSMATPRAHQRRGYGRRLLSASLAAARRTGATTSLLIASSEGEGLYHSAGYRVAEYWQVWSRARWVFPPA